MPRIEKDPSQEPLVHISDKSMSENKTGAWRSIRPEVDREKCTGCLICWKFCPEVCIVMEGEKPAIDMDYCKGCGICAKECPPKCITMVEEEAG